MEPLVRYGRPARLDAVWRPVVRSFLAAVGLTGSALLAWLGWWVWAPLPLAGLLLAHEVLFWARGDRAMVFALVESRISWRDVKNRSSTVIDLSTARACGLGVRAGDGDQDDAFLVMYGEAGPIFAARFEVPRRSWPAPAARLDALQPVLGGNAGIVRGLAPPDAISRQTILDPDGELLRAVLAMVPERDEVTVRAWRGVAPPADFLGLHRGPPDVILTVGPGTWATWDRFTGERRAGALDGTRGGRASRAVDLLDLPGAEAARARLPLIVIELGEGLQLAIPAPLAGHHGDEVPLDEHTLHTHLGEGGLLVWWLVRYLPPGKLPKPLQKAILDARVAGSLHPDLARHVPPG